MRRESQPSTSPVKWIVIGVITLCIMVAGATCFVLVSLNKPDLDYTHATSGTSDFAVARRQIGEQCNANDAIITKIENSPLLGMFHSAQSIADLKESNRSLYVAAMMKVQGKEVAELTGTPEVAATVPPTPPLPSPAPVAVSPPTPPPPVAVVPAPSPPADTPKPDVPIDLADRDATDRALVVTDNAISPKDMFGVTSTNTTVLRANGGKGFNVIRRGTMADGEALLAADYLFGQADVLLLHPRSQDRPCIVDFSKMTRSSKGLLTLRFHNMPGGDCIASAGRATAGVTDIAVTGDQWIPLAVPFDHEDVVLRIQATGWFCEHAFTTYAFSTGSPSPVAAQPDAPAPPPPAVAKALPEPITAQQIAERRATLVAAFDPDIANLQRLWDQLPPSARTDGSSIGLKLGKLKAARAAEVARVGGIPDTKIAADIQHERDQIAAEQVGADNTSNAAAAHIAEWQNVQDQTIGNTTIPAADIVNWRQTRLDEIDRQLAAYEAKNAYLRNPAFKADLESQRKDLLAMTVGDVASRLYDKVHFARH